MTAMDKQTPIESLKAAQLAKRLGIARSYAHKLLQGQRSPSLKVAADIEREFGVPMSAWIARLDAGAPAPREVEGV